MVKRQRKYLTLIAVIICLLVTCLGCSGGNDNAEVEETTQVVETPQTEESVPEPEIVIEEIPTDETREEEIASEPEEIPENTLSKSKNRVEYIGGRNVCKKTADRRQGGNVDPDQ